MPKDKHQTSKSTSQNVPIQDVAIGKIKLAKYNPRVDLKPGDEDYEKIASSLRAFGSLQPLVWNKRSGFLVGGHQRLKIMLADNPKLKTVSVFCVSLSAIDEQLFNVTLNKVGGDWDKPKVGQVIRDLLDQEIDVSLSGFDDDEINAAFADMDAALADTPEDTPGDGPGGEGAGGGSDSPEKPDDETLGVTSSFSVYCQCGSETDQRKLHAYLKKKKLSCTLQTIY